MLEGELAEEAKKSEEIYKYEDMISFLKDQRGLLAEADKSIEEIKEADSLINSEIKSWEEKIEALKA
jgi:predicted  nucleic acid-binding Zn-ribbon protein